MAGFESIPAVPHVEVVERGFGVDVEAAPNDGRDVVDFDFDPMQGGTLAPSRFWWRAHGVRPDGVVVLADVLFLGFDGRDVGLVRCLAGYAEGVADLLPGRSLFSCGSDQDPALADDSLRQSIACLQTSEWIPMLE